MHFIRLALIMILISPLQIIILLLLHGHNEPFHYATYSSISQQPPMSLFCGFFRDHHRRGRRTKSPFSNPHVRHEPRNFDIYVIDLFHPLPSTSFNHHHLLLPPPSHPTRRTFGRLFGGGGGGNAKWTRGLNFITLPYDAFYDDLLLKRPPSSRS